MNPNDPAFPRPYSREEGQISDSLHGAQAGISVRLYLAGLAMQGILASHTGEMPLPRPEWLRKEAYAYADALLAPQ